MKAGQHPSVEKLFQEQVKHYSAAEQPIDSLVVDYFLDWVKKKKIKRKLKICEFGGGVGQLLAKMEKHYPNVQLTNVEIVDDYRQYLVSPKIKFVKRSILNSHFPDNSFDVLIIRDILHHLVGNNYKQTRDNQGQALRELKRLVRPGGVIFVDEYTTDSEKATKIIYLLSKLNFKLGINLPSIKINSKAIVAFLTPNKLKQLCYSIFGRENVIKKVDKVNAELTSKLLHLGAKLERTVIVIKEPIR